MKTELIIPERASQDLQLPSESGASVMQITLKPFSQLRLWHLQNAFADENTIFSLKIILEEGAVCESFFAMIGGAEGKFSVETRLTGAKSTLKEHTVYFGSQTQVFDMTSHTIAVGEGTEAVIESRGILSGSARASFDGNVHLTQTARRSRGILKEHTLLLSPLAKIKVIPVLHIDTNDVFAQHAAGVTRVDDEQLFYCSARGIEKEEAVRLIAEGFLSDMAGGFPNHKKLLPLIEEKICEL